MSGAAAGELLDVTTRRWRQFFVRPAAHNVHLDERARIVSWTPAFFIVFPSVGDRAGRPL